jgi:biopolymer transport protein ExbD
MFPITITLTNPAQLNAVMALLGGPTETPKVEAKVEAPKSQEVAKPEAAPTPITAAAPAAQEVKAENSAPAVTFDQLKKAFLALANKQREVAVKILADNGCAKLTDAKPEQFVAINTAIEKASA